MSRKNTAPQNPPLVEGETVNHTVSVKGKLDGGELGTGTPTVTEVDSSDLTISGVQFNTETLNINGDAAVIAGQAVQCTIVGQLLATLNYTLEVTFETTEGQTRIGYAEFSVSAS